MSRCRAHVDVPGVRQPDLVGAKVKVVIEQGPVLESLVKSTDVVVSGRST